MSVRLASSGLVLALVLTVVVPAYAQAKHTLRIKAQSGPVEYWMRSQETQLRERPDGRVTPAEFGKLELVKQTITAAPDGNIRIEGQLQGREAVINKRRLSNIWAPRKYTTLLSPRNERQDASARSDPNALLIPTFPEGPVAVGHTWKTAIPATKDFPFPVTVTHTLKKIEPLQKLSCAIINSAGEASGRDPKTGVAIQVRFESNLSVAIDLGLVLKSVALAWVNMKYARPAKDGHQVLRRLTYRVVQRRVEGDVPPDVLPASQQPQRSPLPRPSGK